MAPLGSELLEGPLSLDVCGYTGSCHYGRYGLLLCGPSPFLIPAVPASVSPAAVDTGSAAGAANRTDAGSGVEYLSKDTNSTSQYSQPRANLKI